MNNYIELLNRSEVPVILRRSGRTTAMLKHTLKSKKDVVIILAPTVEMAKHVLIKLFIDILEDVGIPYGITTTELTIKALGKTFIFDSEERFNLSYSKYDGRKDYDVHRDHTCYER